MKTHNMFLIGDSWLARRSANNRGNVQKGLEDDSCKDLCWSLEVKDAEMYFMGYGTDIIDIQLSDRLYKLQNRNITVILGISL